MESKILRVILLLVLVSFSYASKVLVVLEDDSIRHTHSIFFKALQEKGYTLDYASDHTGPIRLKYYDDWNYDHLILFSPTQEFPSGVDVTSVLEFIDSGHNVIVAGSSNLGRSTRELASECNIEFDDDETFVIDHFNFDVSDFDKDHTLIVADQILKNEVILGKDGDSTPVLFRGIAQDIEEDSSLLFPLVSAYGTSYSHAPHESIKSVTVAGKKVVLISALQARNSARVIFSGSLEFFSNKFFNSPVQKVSAEGTSKKYEKSGNENFAKQVATWAFHERGILRASNVQHHKVGENESSAVYTIKDNIEYSIQIEEWNGRRWVPFLAKDVQLEYIMLDPYVRTTLKHDDKGVYSVQFVLPDVYGIFTFKVEYNRKGYSNLQSITRVPVRPFRHNEYERFIPSAFPYYASAFSMMIGLFIFSWVFLYHKDTPKH